MEFWRKRPKHNNKAWTKLSEIIISILGDCLENDLSVPHSTTCNLTYWEFFPAIVCLDITGQFGYGHRAKFSPSARGGLWQIAHTSYSRHQRTNSPQTPWIVHFPVTLSLSFQGHINFPNLPASKKLPEEQILSGTCTCTGSPVLRFSPASLRHKEASAASPYNAYSRRLSSFNFFSFNCYWA